MVDHSYLTVKCVKKLAVSENTFCAFSQHTRNGGMRLVFSSPTEQTLEIHITNMGHCFIQRGDRMEPYDPE